MVRRRPEHHRAIARVPLPPMIQDPDALVLGIAKSDCNKLKISFGSYAQVFDSSDNTTNKHSVGAIALKLSNNQGSYFFKSWDTGRRIHSYQWTEFPVTTQVIERVHNMARKQKQPRLVDKTPKFEWRPEFPVYDEVNLQDIDQIENQTPDNVGPTDPLEEYSDDEDWSMDWTDPNDRIFESNPEYDDQDRRRMAKNNPNNVRLSTGEWATIHLNYDSDDLFQQTRATAANAGDIQTESNAGEEDHEPEPSENENEHNMQQEEQQPMEQENVAQNQNETIDIIHNDSNMKTDQDTNVETEQNEHDTEEIENNEEAEIAEYESTLDAEHELTTDEPRYDLRSARKRDYTGHVGGNKFRDKFQLSKQHVKHGVQQMMNQIRAKLFDVCFTQMQAKTRIKKHGQRAVAAMLKEYMQLTNMDVMGFLKYDDLTDEQKRTALKAINIIKEKRNDILKGRTVADGRGQRGLFPKEEATSPTLHLDQFIVSLLIGASEDRSVLTSCISTRKIYYLKVCGGIR